MAIDINLNNVQAVPIVVNASLTPELNKRYTVVASATFTDPSPVEGKGFIVFVVNGTATVGGTGYSTAGTIIYRAYHSGAWSNKVYYDKAYFDTIYQAAGTYLTSANITQTITNGDTTHTPSSDAVKDYADKKVGSAMTQAINEAKGTDIASAATTDIGAATGNYVQVTGTTTITALGTIQAGTRRIVEFTGVLTLTHNGTSLILPTGANITTAAGDVATFVSLGSGNWKCTDYMRYDGSALSGSTKTYGTEMYAAASGTNTYTATLSPAPSAYTTGMQVRIKIPNSNTITNPTLNLNSLGAKTIKGVNDTALPIGQLYPNGDYLFVYNGTDFILQAGIMDRKDVSYYRKTGTTTYERWYSTNITQAALTTYPYFSKDVIRAVPFIVSKTTTLDRIGMEITVAGTASSVMRLGIYDDVNGVPTNLILDAGTIAADSATQQSITISQTLTPGLYYLVCVHNSTSNLTVRAHFAYTCPQLCGFGTTWNIGNNAQTVAATLTYGTLPSTFPTSGIGHVAASVVPGIFVRLA